MSTQPNPILSPKEYLEFERSSDLKHQYDQGEIFAMTGASRKHNRIVSNLTTLLNLFLKERPCNVYPNDLRVRISETGLYTYPDLVVTCGEEIFEDVYQDTLLNPLLIIEVLSPSTEAYDRGKKFQHYQMVGSLIEYVLVSQEEVLIEQFVRQSADQWLYTEVKEGKIKLASIECELVLNDVYAKV